MLQRNDDDARCAVQYARVNLKIERHHLLVFRFDVASSLVTVAYSCTAWVPTKEQAYTHILSIKDSVCFAYTGKTRRQIGPSTSTEIKSLPRDMPLDKVCIGMIL
ncbi:hypothetical protein MPSEU_000368800 [Mayamaea pseudoterrestris]|nr:hypothetical protein MPSEU_000368800 [Mayamaea pseudoterrestris]